MNNCFYFGRQDVKFPYNLLHPCHNVCSSMPLLQRHGGKVKGLHLPIFSNEMAGHSKVCIGGTAGPHISCQCEGAVNLFYALLYQ